MTCACPGCFARIPPQLRTAALGVIVRSNVQRETTNPDRMVPNRNEWLLAWPGLAGLWLRGDLRSLLLALLFAVGVNGALIDTLVWPELFAWGSPLWLWSALALVWICGFFGAIRQLSASDSTAAPATDDSDALFIQAQTEYLSGHWDEAAWLLERRLANVPRDGEARLLLATLRRHQRRFAEAAEQLQVLSRYDEAARWSWEIARERELADQFRMFAEDGPGSGETRGEPEAVQAAADRPALPTPQRTTGPATNPTVRRAA